MSARYSDGELGMPANPTGLPGLRQMAAILRQRFEPQLWAFREALALRVNSRPQ